jgi:integrase
MANLGLKDGIYVVRFRFQGKEYKKSLKTRREEDAQAALSIVRLTIHRLHTGQAQIRAGVDPGDFIVSGGTWAPPPEPAPPPPVFPSTTSLIERFLEVRKAECSKSYLDAQRYHLGHLKKCLGKNSDGECNLVTHATLEKVLRDLKKTSDGETVTRYRVTLTLFCKWVTKEHDVPPFPFPADDLPKFKGSREQDPFRTAEQINRVLERGGLDEEQVLAQWEALYLDPTEIAGLLALVRERAQDPLSFLLHAIPAYTGMRRGEVLRLRWADVDFDSGFVTARSRKQSRKKAEVGRQIDLHPELQQYLLDWQQQRPSGQFVIGTTETLEAISADLANRLFWQPMRDTEWCLIDKRNLFKLGFHTYRHSFASNLAAAGVAEALIDVFMGLQTEAMRRRYRHLFPKNRRSAISSFSLQSTPTIAEPRKVS